MIARGAGPGGCTPSDRPRVSHVHARFAVPVGVVGSQVALRIEHGFGLGVICIGTMCVVAIGYKVRRRITRGRQGSME